MSGATDCPVHSALKQAICIQTKRYLWTPSDAITFVPAVSDRVWGDGRALLGLTTINSRPRYYVVRIDSGWSVDMDRTCPDGCPEVRDHIDGIGEAIEEEFGCGRPSDDDDASDSDGPEWPAFDDRDGVSWARMDWPDLTGMAFGPHPFSQTYRVLRAVGSAA